MLGRFKKLVAQSAKLRARLPEIYRIRLFRVRAITLSIMASLVRGGAGRDRPKAACPPGSRAADGEAGGFNAVQKVLTTRIVPAVSSDRGCGTLVRHVTRDSGRDRHSGSDVVAGVRTWGGRDWHWLSCRWSSNVLMLSVRCWRGECGVAAGLGAWNSTS